MLENSLICKCVLCKKEFENLDPNYLIIFKDSLNSYFGACKNCSVLYEQAKSFELNHEKWDQVNNWSC